MFECHINVLSRPCFRLFQHLTANLPVGTSAPHVWCTSSSEKPLITGDMNHQLKSSTEWCLHDHIHPISSMYMYSIMVRDLSWSPRFQDSPDDILILAAQLLIPDPHQTNINKLCQFLEIHTRFQGRVKARGGTWRSFPIVGRGSDCGEPLLGPPDVGTQNE
jgi:hypothetical protein